MLRLCSPTKYNNYTALAGIMLTGMCFNELLRAIEDGSLSHMMLHGHIQRTEHVFRRFELREQRVVAYL